MTHDLFSFIPDLREKKGEGEEEEITLQQINITVEKVRKKEHDKKEIEKVKRKQKSKVDKTQEPTGKTDKTYLTYKFHFSYVKSSTSTSRLYSKSRFCYDQDVLQ